MERRKLGRTDMIVSSLGFGGAEIGFESAEPEVVSRLLNTALDAGLNVIDTAECYGESESLIGRAAAHRRKDYFLFTKCGHAAGLPGADWDIEMLRASIDRSLERLRTDCVDLLQLHTCGLDLLQKGDVIAVLQKARDQGKTRYIGYSGDREEARWAVESGIFDTLQTSCSIADQQSIDLYLPTAAERGVGVIAKRPIANAAWKHPKQPDNGYVLPYWERLQKLDYDFTKGDMNAAVSTALRFTLSMPAICTAIVGTKNPDRWLSNLQLAQQGPLPDNETGRIRARWKDVAGDDWTGQA